MSSWGGPRLRAQRGGGVIGYVGLGSNVGDRLANMREAIARLPRHGASVEARSSVYETEPQGEVTEQPDFLNACVRIETDLGPEEMLEACKEVERELGRRPAGVRHGPRPIDVDLLLLGELEYRSERLVLPHSDLHRRRFVLEPLLELDPQLALPDGTRLADVLAGLSGQRVEHAGAL